MKIDYKVFPKDKYGAHLHAAMLNVQLSLATPYAPRTKRFEAVIDSGATRCMFHADIGKYLGLDIRSGDLEKTNGIAGVTESWIHPVRLYIPGGAVDIRASFKEDLPVAGLLGMNGFFEHFVVTFMHACLQCELQRIGKA